MDSTKLLRLLPRDSSDFPEDENYSPPMDHLLFALFSLIFFGGILSMALYFLRRKRLARQRAVLPSYRQPSHHRSPSVSNFRSDTRKESVFVYDEKMNLIHNSSSPPPTSIPEIHITFPDDDEKSGEARKDRVVVVHITESGSVGMSPLEQDNLPPYQKEDAGRFQSLDLDRIGGLKEKEPPNLSRRWS